MRKGCPRDTLYFVNKEMYFSTDKMLKIQNIMNLSYDGFES